MPSRCARRVCTSLLRCLPLRRLAPVRKRTATEAQARLVLASPATQVATTPGALPVPCTPASECAQTHARPLRSAHTGLAPQLVPYPTPAPWQAFMDMCEAPDAPRLPPAALRRAAAWLLAALEARCGGAPAPAAAAAAARQFHALLRALAALLAQVRQHQSGPALGRGMLVLNGTCCVRHAMIGVPV